MKSSPFNNTDNVTTMSVGFRIIQKFTIGISV